MEVDSAFLINDVITELLIADSVLIYVDSIYQIVALIYIIADTVY